MITEELKKETLRLNHLEKAWVDESEKRYADFKAGKLDSVPFDAVKKSIVR